MVRKTSVLQKNKVKAKVLFQLSLLVSSFKISRFIVLKSIR